MSSRMPIVVSHYTKGTGYETEVENLKRSLAKWDLEYHIRGIESLGTWRQNSNYCTVLVQDMLELYPDRDILRVDGDARFQSFPELFLKEDFDCDIAAHVHNFRWHHRELLGGTIFFRNNERVKSLVQSWVTVSMKTRKWHRNPDLLQELVDSGHFNVKFSILPDTYCKIFDIMRYVQNPVIEHFQASRRFKRLVNNKVVKERTNEVTDSVHVLLEEHRSEHARNVPE